MDASSGSGDRDDLVGLRLRVELGDDAFRLLVDRLPEAVLVHRQGVVVCANLACAKLLAKGAVRALVGEPISKLALTDAAADGEALVSTVEGDPVCVSVSSVALSFEGAAATLLLLRERASSMKIDARLLLADRMASMGALAAGVAHEANNPLGYALANVDFALEELRAIDTELGAEDSEEQAELLSRLALGRAKLRAVAEALREARHGADRVRHLVRDLKTFSRADDDRQGPVDVRRVIHSAINMANNELRSRAHLVKEFGPTPIVSGNEGRLGQVFLNLILNAAQAISEGDADVQRVQISTTTDDRGRCVVEVSDTGQGIADADLPHIFDPFFTTKTGTGTGLGLAICQAIVTTMGGEISVKSAVGKGTTVRVAIPAAADDVIEASASARSATSQLSASLRARARVLVVDDEPMMARAVQRLLGNEHDIIATTDPKVAVDMVRSGKRFDVVLCDLMMPGMSGMDVYEAVASLDEAQARKFIFMTGGAFTHRAEQFLERIGNPRLDKPLDRSALRAAVRASMT